MIKRIGALGALFVVSFCIEAAADTLYVGSDGEYKSITEAVEISADGDEIVVSEGIYDDSRESFPVDVEKKIYIHAAEGEEVVLRAPITKAGMRIMSEGTKVEDISFEFTRGSGMHIMADNVVIDSCNFILTDTEWRETACGMWIAGSKYVTLTDVAFTESSIALAGPPDKAEHKVPVLTALYEVGEDIEFFTTHTMENVTVNGKPVDYVIGIENQEYTSDCGELIAVNCENVTFTDLDVSCASIGLQLVCSNNCIIKDSKAENSGIFGIYIAKCDDCIVTNIDADNGSHGIDVRDCDRCVVENCSANESGQGIFLTWSRDCRVSGCEVRNCGTGIFSSGGDNNSVDNCVIEGNELGLYIQHEKFTMTNSAIRDNKPCGLRMTDCDSEIGGNSFENNLAGSVVINSEHTVYTDNVFTDNTENDLCIMNSSGLEYDDNIFTEELGENSVVIK